MGTYRFLERLAIDVRVGLRGWRRSPGVVAVAIVILGLGIGASTALFSVVQGILLRPLPYREADRLFVVRAEQDFEGARQPMRATFPASALAAWPAQGAAVDRVAFYAESVGALASEREETSALIDTAVVSGSFFETIGGRLALGRGLEPADDGRPVAVISTRLWRRLHGGADDVLGRSIRLNGQVLTIVGVAADTFRVPRAQNDVWLTAGFARIRNPSCCGFTPIARLKAGASAAAAGEEIAAVARTLAAQSPRALGGVRVQAISLHDAVVGEARPVLLMLTAAVGLVLVLACANVMNLLLARNMARAHDAAIRRALGASRGRLIAQALADSALLAAAGGIAGVTLAVLTVRVLRAWPSASALLPRLDAVQIDGTVFLFALAIAAAVTIAVGLLPALQSGDVRPALEGGQRGRVGSPRARAALRIVSVAQLAIAVVLLVAAALLGRGLVALMRTDVGVTPEHVATASLNLAMDRTLTDRQQIDLVARVIERIAALPHVTAAGAGTARPPDTSRMRLTLNRTDDPSARASYQAAGVPATPGYFRALDIRLERGRLFTDADHAQAPPVVMLSADTARRLFGTQDPIGRTIALPVSRDGRGGQEEMTVIGITANVKYSGLDRMADDVVYRPFAQQAWRSVFLVVRTTGDPAVLASQLSREIAAVDRAITIADVASLDAVLANAAAQPRLRSLLLAAFAAIAILIAGVGVYGVIAYAVSQRRGEIGVRMALGADRRQIRIMVLREGLGLALLGGGIGLAGAYGVTHLLAHLLFGIAATDPASFAFAIAGVIAAGLAASVVPASRAARIDPLIVLKSE